MLSKTELISFYQARGLPADLTSLFKPEFKFFQVSISGGASAFETWQSFRALYSETGYWPLLLGRGFEQSEFPVQVQDIDATLSEVAELTEKQFLKEGWGSLPEPDEGQDEWEEMFEDMGMPAPEAQPVERLSIPFELMTGKAKEHLVMALLPLKEPWQLGALLQIGGWNACPEPKWQVALHRYWFEKHGAEAVSYDGAVLEMSVTQPPEDEAASLHLAREQYLYCPDIVDQGTMTLNNLSKTLLKGSIWYFWWD